jgi:hypothetical protein
MDPSKDKADHTLADQTAATDPICSPSSNSDFEYDRESTWWNGVENHWRKLPKRSNRRPKRRYPVSSIWLGNSTRGRGTMDCWMTQGAQRMSTRMEPYKEAPS